jgi:lycopene cyclase domain-containing protein
VPTAYLWAIDWLALRNGIWTLAPAYTTGWTLFGLPVEEATFFLATNLFVVQGLLLYDWVLDRWE